MSTRQLPVSLFSFSPGHRRVGSPDAPAAREDTRVLDGGERLDLATTHTWASWVTGA